jgi:hypothetical protein
VFILNSYNKLKNKISNRIGLKAVCTDDMIVGTIDGFYIKTIDEGKPEARFTVNYVIDYGDHKRIVNENMVTVLIH